MNKDLIAAMIASTLLGTIFASVVSYVYFQPALENAMSQIRNMSETIGTLNQTVAALNKSLTEIRTSLYYYTTIAGELVYVGNPCTTSPCLPGIVLAVSTETALYYLTVGGTWLWVGNGDFSWDGYVPEEGDHVIVIGYARMKCDLKGEVFSEIEISSLTHSGPETPFSMEVIPEHIKYAVAGQRCIFLVVVEDEEQIIGNGKAVSISVTPPNFAVTVNPPAITSEQVAEVTVVIPDEATVGENLTVTIHGERDGLNQTKTVTVEVWEFRWPIEEIEEMTEGGMRSVCDRFIPWLATNHPELGITDETEWTGIVIKPLMPVEMFYTFFSEEWEMGVSKHVMIPPDDWAKIYLRHRFTEASPSYAFKISSLEAKEEPYAIDPPQSVWR